MYWDVAEAAVAALVPVDAARLAIAAEEKERKLKCGWPSPPPLEVPNVWEKSGLSVGERMVKKYDILVRRRARAWSSVFDHCQGSLDE